jgi:hypothetical protein
VTTPKQEDPIDTLNVLNDRFFGLEPWAYLHTRLIGLIALAGKPRALVKLFKEDITLGRRLKICGPVTVPTPYEVQRFVAVDSEVLLHHAAEAVLRAHLAFASRPDAPWLEIAAHWRPREFKEKVRHRFRDRPAASEDLDETAILYLGRKQPPDGEASYEDWRRATMNIESFIREFATEWLEDAATYNSLKHGLVANPTEQSLLLEYYQGQPMPLAIEGMTLEVVEGEGRSDRSIEWFMRTKWVDIERNLALVWIATRLLKAAWAIAGASYGRPVPDDAEVWYPVDFTPGQLRRKGGVYSARLRRSLIIQVPNGGSRP